ncbi:MAG TPA: hypothetical protein IAD11_02000 [Candidatus Stercorousia faecigallinarum]|jgi:hypothetical protein|nr:MAG TPA: hypothetical protein [Caudoviricetes sp.]HIT91678.1 hypothetical protein [Candidatus Stercorousia faecigallinarum]
MALNNNETHEQGMQQVIDDIDKAQLHCPNSDSAEGQEIKTLNDKEQAELDRFKKDTDLKKTLTIFVIAFTSVWSIAILVLLYLLGFHKIYITDAVTITLLTETLITVLGLPLVVTSHFFPKQK